MQIGFVGLGRMGGNMVHRIRRDSDHEVVAFDPSADAVAAAEGHGAFPHESPWVITLPLMILAVPAVLAGLTNAGNVFGHPLGDLLNGVNPRDPGVYVAGTAVLLAVTLFATYLPARRASHVDPRAALRSN